MLRLSQRSAQEEILESARAIGQTAVSNGALAESAPLGEVHGAGATYRPNGDQLDSTWKSLREVGRMPPLKVYSVPNGQSNRGYTFLALQSITHPEKPEASFVEPRRR